MFLHLFNFVRQCCTLEIKGWAEGCHWPTAVAGKPSHRALSAAKKGCEGLMQQSKLYCPLPAKSRNTSPVSELILMAAASTASELYH